MKVEKRVALNGMRFFAYHGFYPEERLMGTWYEVDVSALYPEEANWESDNLHHAFNYEDIYAVCRKRMETPVKLIETVAQGMGDDLMEKLPEAVQICIAIRKKHPPVGPLVDHSVVTYTIKR